MCSSIDHSCPDFRCDIGLSELVVGQCRVAGRAARDERRRGERRRRARTPHPSHARYRRNGACFLPRGCRLRHYLPHRRQLLSRTMRMLAPDEPGISIAPRVASHQRVRPRSTLSDGRLRGHQALRTELPKRAMHGAQAPWRCVALAPRVAVQTGRPAIRDPSQPVIRSRPAIRDPRRRSTSALDRSRSSTGRRSVRLRAAGPTSSCRQIRLRRRPSG